MALLTENGLLPGYTSGYETLVGVIDYRIAPLITGLSIMPFSTPHMWRCRCSPVCISLLLPIS